MKHVFLTCLRPSSHTLPSHSSHPNGACMSRPGCATARGRLCLDPIFDRHILRGRVCAALHLGESVPWLIRRAACQSCSRVCRRHAHNARAARLHCCQGSADLVFDRSQRLAIASGYPPSGVRPPLQKPQEVVSLRLRGYLACFYLKYLLFRPLMKY
jgi:hypothetical protein